MLIITHKLIMDDISYYKIGREDVKGFALVFPELRLLCYNFNGVSFAKVDT